MRRKNSYNRPPPGCWGLILAAGLAACGGPPEEPAPGEAQAALFQTGTTWPIVSGIATVPVCFRDKGTYSDSLWLERRALVEDTLKDTWQKWSGVRFTGFGTCSTAPGGTITVDMFTDAVNGAGFSGIGYPGTGTLLMSLRIEGVAAALQRTVVAHEFGHALSFHHEQYRNDAWNGITAKCSDDPQIVGGIKLTPYYDDVSVMNYCAPRARNALSAGDIEGVQSLYGISAEGKVAQGQTSNHGPRAIKRKEPL